MAGEEGTSVINGTGDNGTGDDIRGWFVITEVVSSAWTTGWSAMSRTPAIGVLVVGVDAGGAVVVVVDAVDTTDV